MGSYFLIGKLSNAMRLHSQFHATQHDSFLILLTMDKLYVKMSWSFTIIVAAYEASVFFHKDIFRVDIILG